MSDPVENWKTAADGFDRRYRAITVAQWGASTPCSEWTVRDLVTHAAVVQVSFGGALGATVAEDADWPTARAAMEAALSRPGSVEGTTNHPAFGEAPKAMLLSVATNDLLIHTWDLARAIGADETLPADLAASAYAWLQQLPAAAIRGAGRFADEVSVPADADAQTKLLAFAGRRP
jgi:uncharacterized protein (TIGR03086 family)